MRLNVVCEGKSYHTEDELRSSKVLRSPNDSGQSTIETERELLHPMSPGLLNTRIPSTPNAVSPQPYGRISEMNPVSGIGEMMPFEEVMPWRLFTAFAAAIASAGFLFVMVSTGGIHLD